MTSPETRIVGEWLIVSLWSGINLGNAKPGTYKGFVGWTTDKEGIFGEVELVCRAEPSTPLASATVRVYRRFEAESR